MATEFIENLKEFFSLITLPTLVGSAIYFGRKLQTLDSIERTTKVMKDNIKVISNALISSSTIEWDGTLLKDYSPLALTPQGSEYLKNIGFPEIFETHKKDFMEYVQSTNPTTKYDVELQSTQSILLNADEEFMQPIKIYLYNHPKDNLAAFAKISGVYVRDEYLKEHPEITE